MQKNKSIFSPLRGNNVSDTFKVSDTLFPLISKLFTAITICLSISYTAKSQTPTAIREAEMERTFKEIVEAERSRHQMLNGYSASLAGANFDVKYHRFEWKIDPSVRRIAGNVATYFKANEAISTEITFDLNNNMTVDSVIHRGRKALFNQTADKVLRINPNINIISGQLDSVRIYYAGAPDPTGLGSFVQRLRVASDPNSAEIWTLSEPYGGLDWFPGKMDLTDKVDSIDVIVQTPPQYKVASNGILVSETTVAGTQKLTHWKHRYPIANYLIAVAVTNYSVYNDKIKLSRGDSMSIVNYVYPEKLAASQAESYRIQGPMRLFDSLFIEYPFKKEKYGHAMFGWGGGMEHQTMSFMVNVTNIELMAHELAHQWFGDRITCGSWQDLWLNEGFATYLTGLYFENVEPLYWRSWRVNSLGSATSQLSGSVFIPAADTLNDNRLFNGSLTYNKGARVLHALRFKIGDAAFFGGLRNYLNDPLLAYGFARNSDLKRHLEAASGQNLTEFFNDFIFGQGYPSYEITSCQETSFSQSVSGQIKQTQSHSSVSFFEMPVPLKLISKRNGRDSTVIVQVNQNNQNFRVFINSNIFPVDSIAFDPELWLLSKNNKVTHSVCVSTQEVDNQWLANLSPNPVSDLLTIDFKNDKAEKLTVDILNALGQTVFSEKREAFAGDNSMQLPLYNLPSGTYLLKIGNGQKVANRQFVKL